MTTINTQSWGEILAFVNLNILALTEDTPAKVAARAMAERRAGSVLVFDKNKALAGIVTDRDLVCNLLAFDFPPETPLSEVMSGPVLAIKKHAPLSEALALMAEFGIRRIPVMDENEAGKQRCLGIVCLDDLIAARVVPPDVMGRIVQSQIRRKQFSFSKNLFRSEERREQTLNHFYNIISKTTGLTRDYAVSLTRIILHAIIKRLPFTTAAHFIAQLPALLHEELASLRAGPDKMITYENLILDIRLALQCQDEQAQQLVRNFWDGLAQFLNVEVTAIHILGQLPKEWRPFPFAAESDPLSPAQQEGFSFHF